MSIPYRYGLWRPNCQFTDSNPSRKYQKNYTFRRWLQWYALPPCITWILSLSYRIGAKPEMIYWTGKLRKRRWFRRFLISWAYFLENDTGRLIKKGLRLNILSFVFYWTA